ncbi:class I SAM-dependent methyltransferase [Catenuloplanes japonicus]|uniref:class I SAM-dependent methyltransferase n=1 Tax=Catenuloplanes japonicus TaxID=33876 RepID=UPI000526E6DF|nr:methyltransferase [Catenuloplanes japonicus]
MTAEHYFSAEPAAPAERHEVSFTVQGRDYALVAARGVFSAARLDPGTAVLLKKAFLPEPDTSGSFLDLGCGFGPITAVLAAEVPSATVYAVDVNARARELTAENAKRLGASDRVRVGTPDDVPPDVVFDQIWSNPPIRVGKAELHEMLTRWLPRLAPHGVAWLVIARHLGGDSLHQWLVDLGWEVERHASQKGYRVLRVSRP